MFLKGEYPVVQEWDQRGGAGVRGRLNSAQEAVLNFRPGYPAGIPFAIPLVASPAYPVVNPVPDKRWHDNKSKHQRPWHVHQCCNMQGCAGFDIRLAVMNKHHGIQSKVGQAVFSDQALPRCRLTCTAEVADEYRANKRPFYHSSTGHPRVTKEPTSCHHPQNHGCLQKLAFGHCFSDQVRLMAILDLSCRPR